jgi:hypothetical protein
VPKAAVPRGGWLLLPLSSVFLHQAAGVLATHRLIDSVLQTCDNLDKKVSNEAMVGRTPVTQSVSLAVYGRQDLIRTFCSCNPRLINQ